MKKEQFIHSQILIFSMSITNSFYIVWQYRIFWIWFQLLEGNSLSQVEWTGGVIMNRKKELFSSLNSFSHFCPNNLFFHPPQIQTINSQKNFFFLWWSRRWVGCSRWWGGVSKEVSGVFQGGEGVSGMGGSIALYIHFIKCRTWKFVYLPNGRIQLLSTW